MKVFDGAAKTWTVSELIGTIGKERKDIRDFRNKQDYEPGDI